MMRKAELRDNPQTTCCFIDMLYRNTLKVSLFLAGVIQTPPHLCIMNYNNNNIIIVIYIAHNNQKLVLYALYIYTSNNH